MFLEEDHFLEMDSHSITSAKRTRTVKPGEIGGRTGNMRSVLEESLRRIESTSVGASGSWTVLRSLGKRTGHGCVRLLASKYIGRNVLIRGDILSLKWPF